MNAMTSYYIERSSGSIDTYATDLSKVAESRMLIRRMINAEGTDRIALMPNTSEALNTIASGLDWKSGDRVLLNDLEFPANVYPYLNLKSRGVEIDVLHAGNGDVTAEMIHRSMSPRTRVVALSAVQYLTGYRADLRAIGALCRERDIILAVDAIQGVGAIQLDVQDMRIDALAAGGQKWQMAGQGTGFLYLTEELQGRIHQQHLGWLGVQEPWEFSNLAQEPAGSARRYESGTLNIPGIWGLHAALTTILEFGLREIEQQILSLTRTLMDGLRTIDGVELYSPESDRERAGIVTISLPSSVDPRNVFTILAAQEITTGLREGKIRFSPHFYMSTEEMEMTVEATRESIERSRR
jgi:selenocysteine lyase/cysteine desulfurase